MVWARYLPYQSWQRPPEACIRGGLTNSNVWGNDRKDNPQGAANRQEQCWTKLDRRSRRVISDVELDLFKLVRHADDPSFIQPRRNIGRDVRRSMMLVGKNGRATRDKQFVLGVGAAPGSTKTLLRGRYLEAFCMSQLGPLRSSAHPRLRQ